MKYYITTLVLCFTYLICYPQKEIKKNGQKINKIDKQNKKQGSWFYFNKNGDLELSCYYKNDTIVTPMVFYKNNDSIFVRFQKVEHNELFLLKTSCKWVIGSLDTNKADSTKIEILGRYINTKKDAIDIQDDATVTNSPDIKKEVDYWANREIKPLYLFGTEELRDFYYRTFSSSKIVFNKKLVIELTLNETGIIEKVDFPGNLNNLRMDEVIELSYLFSRMERWQPCFSKNKTEKYIMRLYTGTDLKN